MAHRFEPEILEEEWYIIDVFGGLRRKMFAERLLYVDWIEERAL
jgi:hypothetical protein